MQERAIVCKASSKRYRMKIDTLFQSEHNLEEARALVARGDKTQADRLFKQAIDARNEAVGADDPSVAAYLFEYALFRKGNGDGAAAEELCKQSLALYEKAYYAGHFALAPVLEALADLYIARKSWTEAEEALKRCVEINDKCLNGDHRRIYEAIYKLALVYKAENKFAEGETILTKALKTLDTPLGPSEEFRYELAQLYEAQSKMAEAETNYNLALKGLEQRKNYLRLADCLESYSAFLEKASRPKDAARMATVAKKIRETFKRWEQTTDLFPATLLRA